MNSMLYRRAKPVVQQASQHRGYAVLGCFTGVLLACVVFAPASWLSAAVEKASSGQLRLVNPAGSVWNGSAAWVLASGGSGTTALSLPSRIAWRIQPNGMGVKVSLSAPCCTHLPIQVRISAQSLSINAATAQLPMSLLQGLGTPWNTLELRGNLHVRWENFALSWGRSAKNFDGLLELQARNISTRLSTLPEVGSYQAQIRGGGQPLIDVSTLSGALVLTGQGHWKDSKFRFEGQANAHADQAAELANLLTLLGTRSGNKTMIRWG